MGFGEAGEDLLLLSSKKPEPYGISRTSLSSQAGALSSLLLLLKMHIEDEIICGLFRLWFFENKLSNKNWVFWCWNDFLLIIFSLLYQRGFSSCQNLMTFSPPRMSIKLSFFDCQFCPQITYFFKIKTHTIGRTSFSYFSVLISLEVSPFSVFPCSR